MSTSPSITKVKVENVTFPPTVKPPGSTNTLFLGGAGVRALDVGGKFIKVTAIGVYLEDNAVNCLAAKWKGKNAEELAESVEFFRDIVTGDFEKFIRVTMMLPLTGQQYSEKVAENCVAIWKSLGIYTDAEAKAIQNFLEAFKDENFPPGSSILFTLSPTGSLTIGFSKDISVPKAGKIAIENKLLGNSVLESIIGKNGVSPEAKQSLASRLSPLFNENFVMIEEEMKLGISNEIGENDQTAGARKDKGDVTEEDVTIKGNDVVRVNGLMKQPKELDMSYDDDVKPKVEENSVCNADLKLNASSQ